MLNTNRKTVNGIGFLGVGPYPRKTRSHRAWTGMIARCYNKKVQERQPTYKGCSVCVEWHNYQIFAKWYEENYVEGYHLDKDLRIPGNKIYSPDTCKFASSKENIKGTKPKSYVFINPQGFTVSIYNLREFCRTNNLRAGHMSSVHSGKAKFHKKWTKAPT
ncbi:MAG: hypothetical protein JKY62_16995 [Desulfocapsa sp.]|nr:hypothetical protein [Desulfocapsa sp.]